MPGAAAAELGRHERHEAGVGGRILATPILDLKHSHGVDNYGNYGDANLRPKT